MPCVCKTCSCRVSGPIVMLTALGASSWVGAVWWGLSHLLLAVSYLLLGVRVVLYVVLVCLAWWAIVEERVYSRGVLKQHKPRQHGLQKGARPAAAGTRVPVVKTELAEDVVTTQPRSPQAGLTAGSLRAHDAHGGAQQAQRAASSVSSDAGEGALADVDLASSDMSDAESFSDWTFSETASEAGSSPELVPEAPAIPRFPAAQTRASAAEPALLPPVAPRAPPPHARPRVHHAVPVTVAKVASPVDSSTPAVAARQAGGVGSAVARGAEVAPAAVGAAGADASDAAVLAQAGASIAGGDIIREPADETVTRSHHGRRRRKKKGFAARQLEKLVLKPMHDKYEKQAFIIYKGFGKMGGRFERGMRVTGAQVSVAVASAGVAALESVDHLLKKWVLFAGVLTALTLTLLPLPAAVNLHVRMQ